MFLNSIAREHKKEMTDIAVHLLSIFCTSYVTTIGKVCMMISLPIEIQTKFSLPSILIFCVDPIRASFTNHLCTNQR